MSKYTQTEFTEYGNLPLETIEYIYILSPREAEKHRICIRLKTGEYCVFDEVESGRIIADLPVEEKKRGAGG